MSPRSTPTSSSEPSRLMPLPYMMSNSACLKGGAHLFFTTFTRVRLPVISAPSLIASMRRMSSRSDERMQLRRLVLGEHEIGHSPLAPGHELRADPPRIGEIRSKPLARVRSHGLHADLGASAALLRAFLQTLGSQREAAVIHVPD